MQMLEEDNRVAADHISLLLFLPTMTAEHNHRKGGGTRAADLVGDPMVDSYLGFCGDVERKSRMLGRLGLQKRSYLLATVHRPINPENVPSLSDKVGALVCAGQTMALPVHPTSQTYLRRHVFCHELKMTPNVRAIGLVNYLEPIALTRNPAEAVTDSGAAEGSRFRWSAQHKPR